jgi:Fe-S-cluster-containing dehydrogenase component
MCLKEESAEGALIRCTECKDQYHPDCLELKKENIPKMMSFGWRCMHCKKCETCKDTGDEEKVRACVRACVRDARVRETVDD